MKREDILSALELLPIWQLRDAAPQLVLATAPAEQSATMPSETQAVALEAALPPFRMLVSADSAWLFLLEHHQAAEAEALLQNMLQAVAVKPSQDLANANVQDLNKHTAKVIVVMGESVAQQLLKVTQTLDQLRGQPHPYDDTLVIVTYSPAHLLMHLADKAKAWEDLCLAKSTIASLS